MKAPETIWIHPKLAGGYCAVKVYEDEFLYISHGGLNQYTHKQAMGDPDLILINFELFDITLIGDVEEWAAWKKLCEKNDGRFPGRVHRWAMKLLIEHCDLQWFKWIVDNAYAKGVKAGRNDIRKQFATLLREEI